MNDFRAILFVDDLKLWSPQLVQVCMSPLRFFEAKRQRIRIDCTDFEDANCLWSAVCDMKDEKALLPGSRVSWIFSNGKTVTHPAGVPLTEVGFSVLETKEW